LGKKTLKTSRIQARNPLETGKAGRKSIELRRKAVEFFGLGFLMQTL
jgi:hypothetical protein